MSKAKAVNTTEAELLKLAKRIDDVWWKENELYECGVASDIEIDLVKAEGRSAASEMMKLKADTLPGLRAKARALEWCHAGEKPHFTKATVTSDTLDVLIAQSIINDVLAVCSTSRQ